MDQPLWLAPGTWFFEIISLVTEIMLKKSYNKSVDVYAYGIVLWELLTRSLPFKEFPFFQWHAQLEDSIVGGTITTI